MSDAGRLRASDADRERTADHLREHTAQGRLTSAELEERLSSTYIATTLGELAALVDDLPPSPAPVVTAPAVDDHYRERARRRTYRAVGEALLLSLACILIWVLTDPGGDFWPQWVMLATGLRALRVGWRQLGPGGHAELGTLDRHDCRRLERDQRRECGS